MAFVLTVSVAGTARVLSAGRGIGRRLDTLARTKVVPPARSAGRVAGRWLGREWRACRARLTPVLRRVGRWVAAVAVALARRADPILRATHHRVLVPAGRVVLPPLREAGRRLRAALVVIGDRVVPLLHAAGRRLAPVWRRVHRHVLVPVGRAVLAVLPDGTVPALRAAGRWVAATARAGLRYVPRRRAVVVGVLTGSMVAVTPIAILAATTGPTGTAPAAHGNAVPGVAGPVGPGQPAAPGDPAAPTAPTGPVNPANPAAPVAPTTPASPAAPQAPSAPPAPATPAPPPAPAPPPVPAGVSPAQVANATEIAKVAVERGLPDHAVTVALATSLQESGLLNLNYGDRDSLGLFQQRPSAGWGAPEQIMDPHYSAGKFFERLVQVPNWQNLPVTVAAQDVQISAFPYAYAKWQPLAESLAQAVLPLARAAH